MTAEEKLRPIGTEFWYDCPPDLCSVNSFARRIKYRVVEHVDIERPHHSGNMVKAERWEALASEEIK